MKAKFLNFSMLLLAGMALVLQGCLKDQEDPNKQLNAEVKLIDDYLALQATPGVLYDNATGIRFIVNDYGTYAPPASGQRIKATFVGKIFNSSGTFETFEPAGSIDDNVEDVKPDGLQYIYSILLGGSKATVYLPSKYCYGSAGTSEVPPNSILVYDVSLNEVVLTSTQSAQLTADKETIAKFIADSTYNDAIVLPSGVTYRMLKGGIGDHPTPYSVATFTYTLRTLSGNKPSSVIETSTLTDRGIFGLINGLKVGFPVMRAGAKTIFYIPSGLGYGPSGNGAVAANANLVFEVELTSFH